MNRLLYLAVALLLAIPAYGAKRILVTNLDTAEGVLIKHLLDETDAAWKVTLMEAFVAKHPNHVSTTWIQGELQTGYTKAGLFDKALAIGTAILLKDPDDVAVANANLKAAEGTRNPALVREWALTASKTARRLISTPSPTDAAGAAAWQADVEYSKQVETYCDYALYSLATQAPDLAQRIELIDLLRSHSPTSSYNAMLRSQLFVAYQQAGHHARALALAEEDIRTNGNNDDLLLYATTKAYEKSDKGKVTVYAKRIIGTLPGKPAPAGVSDADWARSKAQKIGMAHWMLGMIASAEQRWPDADIHLRAALPNVAHNKGMAADALYHLGVANHRIGEAKNDKNRILDSIRFNQQCASMAGNFQAQAKENVVSLRSQYHLQ